MTSENRNCENCRWVKKSLLRDAQGQVQIGQNVFTCHRFPPTAVLVPSGPGSMTLSAMFPPVAAPMVCSLHDFPDSDGAIQSDNVPGALGA